MTTDNPIAKTARNLTEIEELYALLPEQAIHKANDRLMPGGHATAALAPVASPDEWAETFEAAEHRALTAGDDAPELDDDEWEAPLQTVLYWSEQFRDAHGYPRKPKPTLSSEVAFLRWALDWAVEQPTWETFRRDITRTRTRLENLLYAGNRAERSRVTCVWADCETKPRLIRVYGDDKTRDGHKCPACKQRYDRTAFSMALQIQLHGDGSGKWVLLADALVTMRDLGRGENTIRSWIKRGDVQAERDVAGRVSVWWPDLWEQHRTAPTRGRSA